MKKNKNFICFILILTSLVTFIPTASYAMGDATGEFRVIGCEYTRKKSGYTIHLVIKTINYDKQNFTATFFVDGNTSYSEEISGTIQKDRIWASSSDYEYNISFKVNWKNGGNYNLDISDDAGMLYGFCDNEGILGLDCKFVGAAGAIGKSEKIARMKYSNELYTETRDLSVAVYSDSKTVAASSKSVDAENYENARTGISENFKNSLEKYNYRDIEAYNFNDDNNENVSFAIANKYIKNEGYHCIVVIRGTDGVEWEGNMKVCPPDENGNTDKYTFTNGDDTHYNFLQASKYVENGLKEYLEKHSLNNENTMVVLTGHSRGGAVSNLAAKSLTDNVEILPLVTAYTYATPNVSPYTSDMESYTNIFNFCKSKDFITYIPLVNNKWNYWKYGITYTTGNVDDKVYCNKITDIMASEQYAPYLKDYYEKEFKHKSLDNVSMSLYDFMTLTLAIPMEGDSLFNNVKLVKQLMEWCKNDFKGLNKLSRQFSKDLLYLSNHWQKFYSILEFSDYTKYTYSDALSRCSVGGNDATVQSLMTYATNSIYLADDDRTDNTYNLVETSKIKSFLSNADDDGVTNADKLGWNIDDYTTWNGVAFGKDGRVTSVDLVFKDLYGGIDLSGFTSLKSVDISSNYISTVTITDCTALTDLDISDNEITALDISSNTALENVNFSNNDIESIDLSKNPSIISLECSDCSLNDIDVTSLSNLTTLVCSFNQLESIDISKNANLVNLYCTLNYIDLNDENNKTAFQTVSERENAEVVYEPQYLPKSAVYDETELSALIAFGKIGDNNSILNWIDENGNLIMENVQEYVQFKKIDNVYFADIIDISSTDVSGELNLSSFANLTELYCNNTSLTSLDVSGCSALEFIDCAESKLNSFVLPSNATEKNSPLYSLSCENNYLDINIFSDDVTSNINSKENAVFSYKKQIINADVDMFNSEDYNLLVDFYNQKNNDETLAWNLTKPGEWQQITWKYDSVSKEYRLNECDFNCLDISGDIDLSNATALEKYLFSGSDISTITLPPYSVPDGAFYDCTRLEAVVLTGGSEIGEDAFKYCDVLQGVYIPESITSIATTAFDESTRVKLAGADNSYVQEYANSNDLTFNPGYIACSYVVTRETKSGELNGYYAISEVTATNNESVCASDEYGYFVIFLLENGNYKCNLSHKYGIDSEFEFSISSSNYISTEPCQMINFDFHKDGYINAKDFAVLNRHIRGKDASIDEKYLDINQDGVVNTDDWSFAKYFIT